jgi:putative DNA primase/helicase
VFDGLAYTWEKPPLLYPLADADSAVYTFLSPVPEGFDRQKRTPYTVPETIPEGGRTSALVALAGSLMGKGLSPEAAEAAIREENELRCVPPLTDDELERTVFPALHREKWQITTAPYMHDLQVNGALVEKLRSLDPVNNRRYGWADAGGARLFMDCCGDCVQYASDRRKWLFYDGKRWDADGENAVKEKLKELSDALTVYGLRDVADDRRADFLKWAAKWQQLRQRETILKDAASVRPVKSDRFDRDPLILNVQNGTLDLKTFSLKPHNSGDMLSRVAAVAYDPAATSPRWAQFIEEVTNGDQALAQYIQKAVGYALTGSTSQECLYILFGASSRNGKSTLLETVAAMLGDYAATANPETFTKSARTNDNAPSEDIARLAGVRFVTVSEPPRGMELNASLVKSLTGRDSIKARRLYESSFEYVPQFKLFFNSNHRPRVDDMTVFESERIKLIPFSVHFGRDRRDPYLKDTLQAKENLSGVLNWALEGLRMLRKDGFSMPPAVVQATEEYRRKQDKLLQFLEERTETGAGYEVPLMELHNAFGEWCSASGLVSVGVPRFRELLDERQLITKKKRPAGTGRAGKTAIFVLGLRLLPAN